VLAVLALAPGYLRPRLAALNHWLTFHSLNIDVNFRNGALGFLSIDKQPLRFAYVHVMNRHNAMDEPFVSRT
jgi:hypothetical protein